tara:strand:- start:1397 stop:1714 length:318 start_codon:yes stop_codon:yes gene_type:complete
MMCVKHSPSTRRPRARASIAARRRAPPFRDAKLCRRTRNMARGLKKHLKRLNAPKHWMLDKLGGVFAPKPSPGAMRRAQRVFIASSDDDDRGERAMSLSRDGRVG